MVVTKCKTKLDKVWDQEFNGKQHPGHATAETSQLFVQDTADSSAVIMEIFKGVGAWEETAEEADLPEGNPRINNEKTFTVAKYGKSVTIPKEFFDKYCCRSKIGLNGETFLMGTIPYQAFA